MPARRSLTDTETLALYAWATGTSLTGVAAATGLTTTAVSELLDRLCGLDPEQARRIGSRGYIDESRPPRPPRPPRPEPRPEPARVQPPAPPPMRPIADSTAPVTIRSPHAHWTTRAGCRGLHDLFFDGARTESAAHICRHHCDVAGRCAADLDRIRPVCCVAAGISFGADGRANSRQPRDIGCNRAHTTGTHPPDRSLDLAGART